MTGRYAPSPTGPLHLGSLLAAVASFCQARGQGSAWRLRIDDIDTPRVVSGAERQIREALTAFGLVHDGPVMHQSRRGGAYSGVLAELCRAGHTFECGCTRREAALGPAGVDGPIYPGTCRYGLPEGRRARSIRIRVENRRVAVADDIQGEYCQNLAFDTGDFVVHRADGIVAYQLATVVDDFEQGVTEVVRGVDLLSSTPRQIWIYRCLGLEPPIYAHIPILIDENGEKLGKSTGAPPLDPHRCAEQVCQCLSLLGQRPPSGLSARPVDGVIRWAVDNWDPGSIPRQRTLILR